MPYYIDFPVFNRTGGHWENVGAAALAAHAAMWFANHCAASVNSAEYQASVENALTEVKAAFDAPSVQEVENIFALLDESAETPLTPNQQEAEALLELEHDIVFYNAVIQEHRAGSVCLAGPTLNEARLARAHARMAQRQYLV